MESSSNLTVILLLFSLLIFVLARRNQQLALLKQQFYYELEAFRDRILSFEHRVEIVDRHVNTYVNSLGPEVQDRIHFAQTTIHELYFLLEELDELFSQGDFRGLRAVLLYLGGESDEFLSSWSEDARNRLYRMRNWESDLEETLQSVGHGVAKASDKRRSLLALKSPYGAEPPTIRSLLEANIKLDF